jgi:hypothetical protein
VFGSICKLVARDAKSLGESAVRESGTFTAKTKGSKAGTVRKICRRLGEDRL